MQMNEENQVIIQQGLFALAEKTKSEIIYHSRIFGNDENRTEKQCFGHAKLIKDLVDKLQAVNSMIEKYFPENDEIPF